MLRLRCDSLRKAFIAEKGRMVEVTRDAWLVRVPVGDSDPRHVAERCLTWCVREALSDRRR